MAHNIVLNEGRLLCKLHECFVNFCLNHWHFIQKSCCTGQVHTMALPFSFAHHMHMLFTPHFVQDVMFARVSTFVQKSNTVISRACTHTHEFHSNLTPFIVLPHTMVNSYEIQTKFNTTQTNTNTMTMPMTMAMTMGQVNIAASSLSMYGSLVAKAVTYSYTTKTSYLNRKCTPPPLSNLRKTSKLIRCCRLIIPLFATHRSQTLQIFQVCCCDQQQHNKANDIN